jgi:lysyl oxidase-like protein 2/3/4
VNPTNEVAESDFSNNMMRCRCKYDGQRVWLHNCHTGNLKPHSLCGLREEGDFNGMEMNFL